VLRVHVLSTVGWVGRSWCVDDDVSTLTYRAAGGSIETAGFCTTDSTTLTSAGFVGCRLHYLYQLQQIV